VWGSVRSNAVSLSRTFCIIRNIWWLWNRLCWKRKITQKLFLGHNFIALHIHNKFSTFFFQTLKTNLIIFIFRKAFDYFVNVQSNLTVLMSIRQIISFQNTSVFKSSIINQAQKCWIIISRILSKFFIVQNVQQKPSLNFVSMTTT
jgi:hypothetical protein